MATTTTLTFGPSATTREVSIPIVNDDIVESIENFFGNLQLITPNANVVISPPSTQVNINDDDCRKLF